MAIEESKADEEIISNTEDKDQQPQDEKDSADGIDAEIEALIKGNDVDERAATDLRACSTEVKKKVLARGGFNNARNPSSAVLVRIKDAKVELRNGTSASATSGVGLPTSKEIADYVKLTGVNEQAARALRDASPMVKRRLLSNTSVKDAPDPSAALLALIPPKKGGGAATMSLARSWGLVANSCDVDHFLRKNTVDQDAVAELRDCSTVIQELVIKQGDLSRHSNPSRALMRRIKDAKKDHPEAARSRGEQRGDSAHSQEPPPSGPYGYPPMGYPPDHYGYPPPGYQPPGYPPPGYPGYPPPGYPPPGYPPPGYPGYPPTGYLPPGYPPPGYPQSSQPSAAAGACSRSPSYSYSYSYSPSPARVALKSRSRSPRARNRKRAR